MALPPNIQTYYEQLVKTATKGKVEVEFSLFTKRMRLYCKECKVSLTSDEPENVTTVDYSVGEFIKLHAHTGGHCAHVWVNPSDDGLNFECSKCKKVFDSGNIVKPQALTADFKKVPESKGFVASASAIQSQMEKYADEMAKKAAQLESNAKLIQTQAQIEQINKQSKEQQISTEAAAELIQQQKEEQQALQNILTLLDLKAKNQAMQAAISGMHALPPPSPPPPKAKPLTQPTGRKFR